MNEGNLKMPEPRRVGVWTEGVPIQPKDLIIPKKSPESLDEIPTLPDLDEFQDILETESAEPPITNKKDTDTVNALAEVGSGITSRVEGVDTVLEVLKGYIPPENDTLDTVWTIETLLKHLSEQNTN